jgi:uncharacterized NAD(P)/FAD-binding protein YdhS
MVSTRVVIVGGGPRGLGLLERLVARAASSLSRLMVDIVDPGDVGVGMHLAEQPDYLLLNTVCSQLTAFTDHRMLGGPGPMIAGPSLYEWCRQHDFRLNGRHVEATDHLPRAVLGEYLAWSAKRIMAAAPASMAVRHHRTRAVSVQRAGVGSGERVVLADGTVLEADHVVLTIGHGPVHGASPYPLPGSVQTVQAGEAVALLGVGLTAMDVLAALTVGRDGVFDHDRNGQLRYVPSGQEPRVTLLSRRGVPSRARPALRSGRRMTPAAYFTRNRIEQLRESGRELDFVDDVLPLILEEMCHRWRLFGGTGTPPPFTAMLFNGPPPTALRSDDSYTQWYRKALTDDLVQAERGLGVDPVKEALEVLRDHRDVIRLAVDHDGLTSASRGWFYRTFAPAVNRVVIGPQKERHQELLALIDAGLVTIGPGPATRIDNLTSGRYRLSSTSLDKPVGLSVDHVVSGNYPALDLGAQPDSLLSSLDADGRIRIVTVSDRPFGLSVDHAHRVCDADGYPQPTLTALGPLAEGSTYYNHYVASPDAPSRASVDADRLSGDLLQQHQPRDTARRTLEQEPAHV